MMPISIRWLIGTDRPEVCAIESASYPNPNRISEYLAD